MGDAIICFTCCLTEQPPPKRRRRRIDASMIGQPTNFQHTGHIGSGDVGNRSHCHPLMENGLNSIQNQMSSKGGYEHISSISHQIPVKDLQKENLENHT